MARCIAYEETKARVAGMLDNLSYGKGKGAVRGALEAVAEWSGKSPEALAKMLLDLKK